jgi:heat shock protein HslJ
MGCLGVVLFMGGCTSSDVTHTEKEPAQLLEDSTWDMSTYLSVSGTMASRVEPSMVTLSFAEGKISGNAGANKFFGSVEIDGTAIAFSPMGSSMMMGTPELMAQEGQFLKLLGQSVAYQLVGTDLYLQNKDGEVVLTFKPRVEPTLTSNVWNAMQVNNGKGGVASLVIGTEISAEFSDDGRVSGSSGCNTFSGGYERTGTAITFSPLAGTRKMCAEPAGVMEQEAAFLQALEHSTVYSISENRLELRNQEGALQVQFRLKD